MPERTFGVVPAETLLAQDGLTFLRGVIDGRFPAPRPADPQSQI